VVLNKDDIQQFEQRYRTAFINSLAGFRQAVLVGSKSAAGNTNLAIFSSLIHLGANPALLGLVNRPDSVQTMLRLQIMKKPIKHQRGMTKVFQNLRKLILMNYIIQPVSHHLWKRL
jgi:hypothetical protein